MGYFLRSRFVTHSLVFVGMLCASFGTFLYAWQFSRAWPNPTTMAKVIKAFAMVFHALFAFQSLLTWHSLRVTSRSLSFGLWSTFALASLVADSWWFGMMVSRGGFAAVCGKDGDSCARKSVTIASCVFFGAYGVYRLFVLLVVFHFDVHFNETVLPTMSTSTTPAPMTMISAAPTMFAAAPGSTAVRSLSKKLIPRGSRPHGGWGLFPERAHWANLARWTPMDAGAGRPPRAGGGGGAGAVPLIAVSLHDGDDDGYKDEDEVDERGHGVLFDAAAGPDPVARGRTARAKDKEDSSDLSSSSEDEEDDDDDEAQTAYEARRAARRSTRAKELEAGEGEGERGRYAQV